MSWYNNDNWYKPNYEENEESSKTAPEAKAISSSRRSRIISLVICICLVAAAACFALVYNQSRRQVNTPDMGIMPAYWHDYFDKLYGDIESSTTDIQLPTVDNRGKLSLRFSGGASPVLDFNSIYKKCVSSVVGIKSYGSKSNTSYSWGTGVIASTDGYIITNTHVIDSGKRAEVVLCNGESYEAKLVGADSNSDIAVLKINAKNLTPASFASSSGVSVGDTAIAIGNPLSENFSFTMTSGIISAISREINYNGISMNLMQTNAAINEGNSGGPLINNRGEVIGITNMKMVSTYSSNIEGIGFAIPSDTVKNIVDALMADGAVYGRVTIGITISPVTSEIAEYYDIPDGLYISKVLDNSDAAKKGIEVGDIIIAVNGEDVHENDDLAKAKDALGIGDTIHFTIWRDGKTFETDVLLMDGADIK